MGFGEGAPFIVNAAGISPYYSISFAKNNLTVYQGQTFTDILSVYAVSPLQTIALSYSGSSPSSGITASLSPSYGTPDFNSTVTIFVPGNTAPGNYSLRFVGNNGYYKVSTLLNVTVLKSNFYVTLNPNSSTVHAGSSTSFTATAYSNIAPQTVNWSYNAPQGVSVSLSSQTSDIGQPITVTASVSPNAVFNGSVSITIFANSNDSFTANATYTLTPQFYLTMNANSSNAGSVSPSSGWYNAGSVVTITATPNTGYKFAGWTGSGTQSYTGSNNPATVVMDSNIEETASFSIETVVITFSANGLNSLAQGSVLNINGQNYSYSQLPYTLIVPYDTQVTYKWYSPISGGSNTLFVLNSVSGLETSQFATFTAIKNGSIIANYIEKEGITFSANGLNNNAQGTVLTVNGQNYTYSQLPVTITEPVGSSISFSWSSPVSGGTGTQFVWVSTSGLSTSQSGTITVTSSGGDVVASYQEQFYLTMSANPSNAGSVSPASGWYNAGANVQISASANSGYLFVSWSGVGTISYSGSNNPATITMNSPINETALFGFQVTVENTFGGIATASYNGQTYYSNTTFVVPYGSQVTFTASANQGYFFDTWAGTQSSMSNTLTLTITQPTTEIAEFGFYITFNASGLGSNAQGAVLSVNGQNYTYSQLPVTIPVNYGQSVSYSFYSPIYASTNGVRYVWVSTSGLDNKQSDTFTLHQSGYITGNYITQYELIMSVYPSGAGTTNPSGSSWYNAGTQVKISATPNSGYQFVSWSGSGSSSYTGSNNPATITMNSPVTEVANFNIGITFSANGLNGNAQNTVLTVNGASYSYSQLPVTIYVTPGSTINFAWSSPVSGSTGTRFVWTSTSGLSTSQSGAIIVSSPGSVTATYQEQFYLTMNANPPSGGSVSPASGWYNTGSQITISATPNNVFAFLNWTGSGSGSYTGTNNPATITLNGPITETANFGVKISFPTLTAYDVANQYTGYNYEFAVVGQAMYNDPVPLANQQLTIVVVVTSTSLGTTYNKTITVTTNSQGWFYTGVQTIGGGYLVWGSGVSNKELYIYYNGTLVKQFGGWAWGVYIPYVQAQNGSVSISVPSWNGLQLYSNITFQGVLLPSGVTVEFNTVPNPGNYFEQYAFYGGSSNLLFKTGQNPYQYTFATTSVTGVSQIIEIDSISAQAQLTFVVTIPSYTVLNFTLTLNGPNGYTTSWSGYLENLPHSPYYEASHTFTDLPPGTYSWSITPTSVANIYNSQEVYNATPSSGTFNANSSQTVYIVYGGHLYNVTFKESGLPSGATWWVDFNGYNVSTTSQSIEFTNVPDGTFSYTAGPQYYYVSSNTRYAGGGNGSISVNGNTQQTISWVKQFEVITTFTPSNAYSTGVEPAPNANGVANTWIDSGASLTVIGAPADYWVVKHPFITSPSITPTSSGYIQTGGIYYYASKYTITQPENITVKFAHEAIKVQENGIPKGTIWYVLYGGQSYQGNTGSPITVYWNGNDSDTTVFGGVVYYNGIYYIATTTTSFPISEKYNQWQTETIYYEYTYVVTINAGPDGSVSWSAFYTLAPPVYIPGIGLTTSGIVNAGQSQTMYVANGIVLQLIDNPNPGYAFASWNFSGGVAPAAEYSSNSNPTFIHNTGSTGSVTATYRSPDYLQFTVTGASVNIKYTITLSNGQSQSGNTNYGSSTVTFYVPPGTYSWSILPANTMVYVDGIGVEYDAVPSSSSATTNASVSINYVLSSSTYNYTWSETGLPSGTQWGVSVNGINYTTTSTSLTETFNTGQTYSWSVINPSGYVGTPSSGSFSSPGSKSITFYTTPSVSISANPSSGSAPLTVTYTASASGGSGSYEYDFEYINNSGNFQWSGWQTSNTFTYTYNSNGVYYTMVEVKDTVTGATATSKYAQVTVSAPPLNVTIYASPTSGNAPLGVQFYSNVSGGVGNYQYTWYFGDGGMSTSANPSHTYTSPGTYNVQLEVTSGSQTAYSNTLTITVTQEQLQASINASPTSGVAPLTVTYTASATGGSGNYQYDFYYETNSGSFVWSGWQSSNSISYTYTVYTTVQASVEVKDTVTGAMAMSSPVQVTITPPPLSVTANANPTSGVAPLTVSFTASASGGSGGNSYSWNFGDGSTSTSQNPTHTYNNPGTYTATVTVTDSYGQQASASVTISVSPPPLKVTISAHPTSGSEPLTVNFYSTVSGGVGNYQYYWSFGDGATSTQANPTHTYYKAGTYYVKLFVRSGSQSAYSNIITIKVVVPTYSYTFYESGLPTGAVWTVTMNGNSKSAGAGDSITFTGLSGTNSWSAPAVTVYEGPWWHRVRVTYYPHPSSGTVSGSGSTTISYTD